MRARHNFPISGRTAHPVFVAATVRIKLAAAETNMRLGVLDRRRGRAIVRAAREVLAGQWREHFIVDVFQAGAGTSHNMNANEVLANRASELLGGRRGEYRLVHPNDHVNMAQSTNDVIPTAVRLAALALVDPLLAVLRDCDAAFRHKARAFDRVLKSGRTHLQDAVPVRLGQEFGAYALAIRRDRERIARAADGLRRLGIGGTATGTGLNAHPRYHAEMVRRLSALSGQRLRSSGNLFESMQSAADFVECSAAVRTLAVTLTRVANDLRLLSSGPTTGLAEITLPPVQPGSSIMPGKVNPAMAEMLNMVCYHVIGNDTAVMMAGQAGQLELNVMVPVIAHNVLESLELMTAAVRVFTARCVRGITADPARCRHWLETSLGLATALNAYLGYGRAADVAKEAARTRRSIREIVLERGWLSAAALDRILAPAVMTEPGIPGRMDGRRRRP